MTTETNSSATNATTDTGTKQKENSKAIDEFYKQELIREWERREQSRRVDAEYVARRMPYEENKRGWWEK